MFDKHFKNCMAWRLVDTPRELVDLPLLNEKLAERPAGVPGPHSISATGWILPLGVDGEFAEELSVYGTAIAMNIAERKLSSKVVAQEVSRRAAKLSREEEGRKILSREKQRIKEQVYEELLPKAFVEHTQLVAIIELPYIFIATGSAKRAEQLLDLLRVSLGSLKVIPVNPITPSIRRYTEWFTSGDVDSDDFKLGDKFTVHDEATKRKVSGNWKAGDVELAAQLIQGGAKATVLELVWISNNLSGYVPFTVNEMLGVKGIKWPSELQTAAQDMAGEDDDDLAVMHRATGILVADNLGQLWERLLGALGGENVPRSQDDIEPEPEEADDYEDLI